MIKRVETLHVIPIGQLPDLDDVAKAISHAQNHDCIVELKWFCRSARAHGGKNSAIISPDDDAIEVYDKMTHGGYAYDDNHSEPSWIL